ncbi:MAG: SgcJ/EcaC family oxidoreductase [Chthoniobacterales bacterium]|nr:SgcJ/EcaC family oxidoreductase [Chthoniobacterales bacterium]
MNKPLVTLSFLSLAVFFPKAAFCDSQERDETDIRNVETLQEEAWNRHDAKAYANLFTEDGDCVNVVGWWWKGRAEIEKKLTDAYVFVFRESVLTVKDVAIKFLAPEIAVAHVRWTMIGARTPTGLPPPQQGIQVQVLQKQGGKWLIAVFQNTNALPESPFPKGPPAAAPTAGVTP